MVCLNEALGCLKRGGFVCSWLSKCEAGFLGMESFALPLLASSQAPKQVAPRGAEVPRCPAPGMEVQG